MKKRITFGLFLITLLYATNINAQLIVADWDTQNPQEVFTSSGILTENADNPDATGINTSAGVLKYERAGGSINEFYTIEFPASKLILKPVFKMQVYMPVVGDIKISLTDSDGNAVASMVKTISASSMWQEISCDFAGAVLASQHYNKLLISAGYNTENSEAYFFDNMEFYNGFSTSENAVIALDKFMGSPNDQNSFEGLTVDVLNWWNRNGEITNDSIVINRYASCSWIESGYVYPYPSQHAVVELGTANNYQKTDTLIISNISTTGFTDYQVVFSSGGFQNTSSPNLFIRKNNEEWMPIAYAGVDSVNNQIIQYKINTGIISADLVSIKLACNNANDGQWIDDLGLIGKPVYVATLAINSTNNVSTLAMGSTLQLTYNSAPNNALDTLATWSIVNGTGSASINEDGVLTPISAGAVTVKATANDGSGVMAEKSITIVQASSVNITTNGDVREINTNNGTLQLNVTVLPAEALQNVSWSMVDVADEDTATISDNGLLTANRNGMVEVVATTNDGTNLSDTISVTLSNQIIEPDTLFIKETSITIDDQQIQMTIDSVYPLDADPSVIWSIISDDADTATITLQGLLTPIRNGIVTVKAVSSVEGVAIMDTIEVLISGQTVNVESINITSGNSISTNNGTLKLMAEVLPSDAENKNISWSIISGDSDTASIVGNILTAIRNGSVMVSARSVENADAFSEQEIFISNQVVELEALQVVGDDIDTNGGTSLMTAVYDPNDAQNVNIKWALGNASDSAKATISETGMVEAFGNGVVTIVATDMATGITVSGTIEILNQVLVSEIRLINDADSLITQNKGTLQVYAEPLPFDARIKDLLWSISALDGNAVIDENGLVTAKRNGDVYVKATAKDAGAHTDSMMVHISGQIEVSEVIFLTDTAYITVDDGILTLDVEVNPVNAADLSLTWSIVNASSNLAEIDPASGLIKALRNGNAWIKATSNSNQSVYDTALVIISNQVIFPDEIFLRAAGEADSITVNDGSLQLHVDVNPVDAVKDVVWGIKSDSPNLATVDSLGLVTAFRNGVVFVQATSTLVPTLGASYKLVIANQVVEPTSLSILSERGATTIDKNNGTLKLIPNVSPKDAVSDVTWSIISEADADTASISNEGVITAIRDGSVTIQAVSSLVDTLVATIDINIFNQIIEPTSITIISKSGTNIIDVNDGTVELEVNVTPADAIKDVEWSVSMFDVDTASVNSDGVVQAIRNGSVSIMAVSSLDRSVIDVYQVEITNQVIEPKSLYIYGKNDAKEISSNKGTLQMMFIPDPADAVKDVVWSIANDDMALASIDSTGLLHAISNGVATVVAHSAVDTSIMDQTEISISNQFVLISEIILSTEGNATGIDKNGGTLQIIAEIIPDSAMFQNLEWSSDHNEVATVSNTGWVTAVADGNVLISATAKDGSEVSASIQLAITNQTVGILQVVNNALDVYPNPANDILKINTNMTFTKAVIVSSNGQVMDITTEINKNKTINIDALHSGLYLIRAFSENKVYIAMFVKE